MRSLSARRAWIEIVPFRGHDFWPRVALRKESVDRNSILTLKQIPLTGSLSARRAWIEIVGSGIVGNTDVSLSARRAWIEMVDRLIDVCKAQSLSARRAWIEMSPLMWPWSPLNSRSPQGERG